MSHLSIRFTLAAGAAALLAGCGENAQQAEVEQQPDANPAMTIPTLADETSAPVFVEKLGAGNMYEIEAARLALDESENTQVREFAQMIIDDHQSAAANLQAAISQSGLNVSPPAAAPEDQREKLETLRAISPEDFDETYIEQQIDAHQSALNLLQRYANDGDQQALQAFAADTAAVVQTHLDRAEELDEVVGDGVRSADDAMMEDDARVGQSAANEGAY